ncbi:MAG: GerAB/ArcD/ProY family transporter [Bacillota bacterium]
MTVGVIYIGAKIFLAFPRTMAELGGPAAWMIVLIASLASSLSWLAIWGLLSQHPGKTLPEATEATLGPWLGSLVNLAYASLFYAVTFLVLRQFSENIVAAILPKTPLPVVIIGLLVVIAYGSLLGIEAIARSAWFVTPFMVVGVVALLAGGLFTYRGLNALTPFWGPGLLPVAGWGLIKVSLFAEILVVGLLAGQVRTQRDLLVSGWLTLAGSALAFLVTVVVYSYVFPYPGSSRVSFPLLEISRVIITGRWFQRVESIFFIIWVLAGALKLSISLYGCARFLAHVMNLSQYQHLVVPLSVTVYSAALLPPSLPAAVSLDANLLRNWGWIVSLLLPLITWVVSAIRRGGRASYVA